MSVRLFICVMCLLCVFPYSAQDDSREMITPENVHQLEEIARYGNGIFTGYVAFRPESTTMAVAGSIGVWFYDTADITLLPTLLDLNQWVDDVGYSPDGRYFAYRIRESREVVVIEASTGEERLRVAQADTFAFHPESGQIAISTRLDFGGQGIYTTRPEISIYDLPSGELDRIYDFRFWGKARGFSTDLAFSPDGSYLAISVADFAFDTCANVNKSVFVWRMDEDANQIPITISMREDVLFSMDSAHIFTRDGDFLLNDVVYLYDIETQTIQSTFTSGDESDIVLNFALSADEDTLLAMDPEEVRIWDVESQTLQQVFELEYPITEVAFIPDSDQIVAVSPTELQIVHVSEGPLQQISLEDSLRGVIIHPSGNLVLNTTTPDIWAFTAKGELTRRSLQFPSTWEQSISENGAVVLFVEGERLYVWDVEAFRDTLIQLNYDPQDTWHLSPDGTVLLQHQSTGEMVLWDSTTGEPYSTLEGEFYGEITIAISPDVSHIAISHRINETTLQLGIWDGISGQLVWDLGVYDASGEDIGIPVFSEDSTRLAIYNFPTEATEDNHLVSNVRVFDVETREVHYADDRVGRLSPDFRYFVYYGEREIGSVSPPPAEVTDTITEEAVYIRGGIANFSAQDNFYTSQWSSVNLCSGDQRVVTLHGSTRDGVPLQVYLAARPGGIGDVAEFNRNGRLLAVTESRLQIFDTISHDELYRQQFTHDRQARFNTADSLLVTIGEDGTIRLFGVG